MNRNQRVVNSGEIDGRKYAIVRNERLSDNDKVEDMKWYCAYVQVHEDEFLYEIATSGEKHDLPARVQGGFSYSGWGYPAIDLENNFFVGWDYRHSFSEHVSEDSVMEDIEKCIYQFEEATLEEVTGEKLSRAPSWFKRGIEGLYG